MPFKLFDRYIIGIFIRQLLFSLIAAAVIFIIVDLIEHLDRFIDKNVGFWVIFRYYGYFLPYILYLVLPVAILLATLFTIGGLSRTHELTAMKASGINLHRILFHLLFIGILLSGWNFIFGETVVPYSNKMNKDIYRYHVKGIKSDKAGRRGDIYLRNQPDEHVHIKYYDAEKETVFNLDWQHYDKEIMKQRIVARKALWRDSSWVIDIGSRWTFYPDSSVRRQFTDMTFSDLGFGPSDLIKVQTDPEEMGYWQLDNFVTRLRDMGGDPQRWSVELAFKTSMPWTCAIVILLGVPIAAHYRRSGVSLSFGIGLFISVVYFGLQQIGKVLGFNGALEPHYAAWAGNLLFLLVGIFLYWKVEK